MFHTLTTFECIFLLLEFPFVIGAIVDLGLEQNIEVEAIRGRVLLNTRPYKALLDSVVV